MQVTAHSQKVPSTFNFSHLPNKFGLLFVRKVEYSKKNLVHCSIYVVNVVEGSLALLGCLRVDGVCAHPLLLSESLIVFLADCGYQVGSVQYSFYWNLQKYVSVQYSSLVVQSVTPIKYSAGY